MGGGNKPKTSPPTARRTAPPSPAPAVSPRVEISVPPTPRRRWPRVTPSTVDIPPTAFGRECLRRADHPGLQRGTLIHRWFEMIEWADRSPGVPPRDHLVQVACAGSSAVDHDTAEALVRAQLGPAEGRGRPAAAPERQLRFDHAPQL